MIFPDVLKTALVGHIFIPGQEKINCGPIACDDPIYE